MELKIIAAVRSRGIVDIPAWLCFIILCVVTGFVHFLIPEGPWTASGRFNRLLAAGQSHMRLRDRPVHLAQSFAAYHQAALMVDPSPDVGTWDSRSRGLSSMDPILDKSNGCEHLWDQIRIDRELRAYDAHPKFALIFYRMALCVDDDRQALGWLDAARYQADFGRRYRPNPEVKAGYDWLDREVVARLASANAK